MADKEVRVKLTADTSEFDKAIRRLRSPHDRNQEWLLFGIMLAILILAGAVVLSS